MGSILSGRDIITYTKKIILLGDHEINRGVTTETLFW